MDKKYPQRLFREGHEPQTYQINNSCRMPVLDLIKDTLPREYAIVQKDSVFRPILELHENNLGYLGKLIHIMLTRQLMTKTQYEMWFVFGKKPLRFLMQKFHAVTELKYKDDFKADLDDGRFWSKVLRNCEKVALLKMKKLYMNQAPGWDEPDKIRMVYLGVIAAILFGYSDVKAIPTEYIKLVMDKQKVWTYHWGLVSFDYLLKYIRKREKELNNPINYSLEGFSYALQIWAMESIPLIGELIGVKLSKKFKFPRCSNWAGNRDLGLMTLLR